ncbi:hypothetical protein VPH35_139398 [Triticum aestivum]|uniref:Uncharacterized protein n=1 Tax=Aegilops tauschii subsp. strangulata TaxID=200361 RepID=A0A453SU88_AEGTS
MTPRSWTARRTEQRQRGGWNEEGGGSALSSGAAGGRWEVGARRRAATAVSTHEFVAAQGVAREAGKERAEVRRYGGASGKRRGARPRHRLCAAEDGRRLEQPRGTALRRRHRRPPPPLRLVGSGAPRFAAAPLQGDPRDPVVIASSSDEASSSFRAKLRDFRKPASPSARLARFLNTIFAVKRTPYARSSASSYLRSCLSKMHH